MASATAFRSFAIAVAIVIAIIEPHVSGFVIHQNNTKEKKVLTPVKNAYGTHNMVKDEKGQGAKSDKNHKYVTETEMVTTESEGKTTNIERVTTDSALNPTISSDTIEVLDSTEVTRDNLPLLSDEKTDNINKLEVVTSDRTRKDNTITTTDTTKIVQSTTETEITFTKQKTKNVTTTPILEEITTAELTTNPTSTKMMLNSTLTSSLAPEITTDMDSTELMNEQYAKDEVSTLLSETEPAVTVEDVTSTSINEFTTDDAVATTPEPKRKKYTTIERKRGETSATKAVDDTIITNTSYSNDVQMSSSTTTATVYKPDLSPHNKTGDTLSAETAKAMLSVQPTISSFNMISDDFKALNDDVKKTGTVATKRGGFLNLSDNTTEHYTPEYFEAERKPSGFERSRTGRISESQRRLAEDAIREEFLKEEAMSNNEQNYNKFEGESTAGAQSSGDSLSVQPINYDRNKTLYTVSTNYKPMKKIDVQPAKPFLRDPDDNSWRNESISSLGIVFNPKNSSKSFKEVLKNKTQTELNNLQEKENKDDVPDLRVRLEKIAEVRKTKKKKTNKNGEVIYTDYEEASAESGKEAVTTTTVAPRPPLTSITEPDHTTVTEISPATSTGTTNETITIPSIDSFFDRMRTLAPFTTHKTKTFDAAQYYDTTDEYDADYVTLSNIDLKKEFKANTPRARPRTSTPPATTAPVKHYPSERRPTLQYFPPLTTPSVNVDHDFERKVNMFTVKEPERREPFYVTLPPPPMATERDPPPTHVTSPPAPHEEAPPAPDVYLTDDETFRRGSYVIKHYRDYLQRAGDDEEAARPATEAPRTDYDYDAQFRRDVLSRFVDNFNEHSARFKADFPVLYNSSVVHRADEGAVASSRAFMRRVHEPPAPPPRVHELPPPPPRVQELPPPPRLVYTAVSPLPPASPPRPCEPSCAVELSAAYELYYVPEQEERAAPAPHRL